MEIDPLLVNQDTYVYLLPGTSWMWGDRRITLQEDGNVLNGWGDLEHPRQWLVEEGNLVVLASGFKHRFTYVDNKTLSGVREDGVQFQITWEANP